MTIDGKLEREFSELEKTLREKYGYNSMYELFEVPNGSDYYSTVKPQFREKAFKYHPDIPESKKYPDADERMKTINAANDILSNPEKRAAYDEWLRLKAAGSAHSNSDSWQGAGAGQASQQRQQHGHQDPTTHRNRTDSASGGRRSAGPQGSRVRTNRIFVDGVEIFPDGASSFEGDLKHQVNRSYDNVTSVFVNNAMGSLKLGLSNDGKVYVEGSAAGEPDYRSGTLGISDLEGMLILPLDRNIIVTIKSSVGHISGEVAHRGLIETNVGGLDLKLRRPLQVSVKTLMGRVDVDGMIFRGDGFYSPPYATPVGTLNLETSVGGIRLSYIQT